MLRKVIYTIIVSLLILGITGCNDGKPDPTGDNPTVSYTTSITDTTPSFTEVSLPEQIPPTTIQTEPTHAASRQITWELGFYGAPNSDGQKEINRLLLEKGYDCEIQFVPTGAYTTDMIRPWLEDYEANNPPLDILCTGSFNLELFQAIDFVREKYISLSDYLASEEGHALKEFFSPFEWSSTTIDGSIYAIPLMISPEAYTPSGYLYVANRYAEWFCDFDGSYSMLMDIYTAHHTMNEVIEIGETYSLQNFLPYEEFMWSAPYDPKVQSFIDISVAPECVELIKQMAKDFRGGKLVSPILEHVADEDKFAFIAYTNIEQEGFTVFPLSGYANYINLNMSYGVSQKSENKEIALEILSACYTDPEISVYLLPEMESEEAIAKRRSVMSQIDPGDIQGFFLVLTKTQQETMIRYLHAYRSVLDNMIIYAYDEELKTERWMMNDEYDVDELINELKKPEFRLLLQELNVQLAEYLKARNEQ